MNVVYVRAVTSVDFVVILITVAVDIAVSDRVSSTLRGVTIHDVTVTVTDVCVIVAVVVVVVVAVAVDVFAGAAAAIVTGTTGTKTIAQRTKLFQDRNRLNPFRDSPLHLSQQFSFVFHNYFGI